MRCYYRGLPADARAAVLIGLLVLGACDGAPTGRDALVADGGPEVVLMDFAEPFPLDPPPAGWYHRLFFARLPMSMGFATKDGVAAIRLETNNSASMLVRRVDIPIEDYPMLAWRWYVEQPIESALDERTRAGDDHPARLFLTFRTEFGDERSLEIIWANGRLEPGEVMYIEDFPHFVANGGGGNVGRWHDEEVDLRWLYRGLWGDAEAVRLSKIALFCDSDETGARSVSYFADIRMRRRP